MPTLTLSLTPNPAVMAPLADPQLCYALLHIGTSGGEAGARPVNWALVADASRSMRIPIATKELTCATRRLGGK